MLSPIEILKTQFIKSLYFNFLLASFISFDDRFRSAILFDAILVNNQLNMQRMWRHKTFYAKSSILMALNYRFVTKEIQKKNYFPNYI